MISVKKVPCHPVCENTAEFNPSIYLFVLFFFWGGGGGRIKIQRNVEKPTEELALFQVHRYTSFNLASLTDVCFLRLSDEQRQAQSAEIREKTAPVLQA